jgi:hypothetical protein
MAIEEMEATWKGFVCHHCGGQFSIQASRSPYKCPICLSTSLEPAPQDEPYLFGTRHIKGVNAAKTSTNRPGSRQAPWQPVALRQETWKDWMEGILLFATHEIGFFVCLATIGVVIGLLYMIFRLLSRAIFWAF